MPRARSTSSRRTVSSPRGTARRGSARRRRAWLGLSLDGFEDQRGLVAAARVHVLAGHVLQCGVTLPGGPEPMLAVPAGAEQTRERVGRPHADADAVGLRRVEGLGQIVRMA